MVTYISFVCIDGNLRSNCIFEQISIGEVKQIQHTCMCWYIHTHKHIHKHLRANTAEPWHWACVLYSNQPLPMRTRAWPQAHSTSDQWPFLHFVNWKNLSLCMVLSLRVSLSLLSCNCWLSNQSEEVVNVKTFSCMRPHLVLSVIIEIRVSGFNVLAFKLSWLFSWIPGSLLRWGLDLTSCLISMAIYQKPCNALSTGRGTSAFYLTI